MILAGIAINAIAAGGTGFLAYIARDPQARVSRERVMKSIEHGLEQRRVRRGGGVRCDIRRRSGPKERL